MVFVIDNHQQEKPQQRIYLKMDRTRSKLIAIISVSKDLKESTFKPESCNEEPV